MQIYIKEGETLRELGEDEWLELVAGNLELKKK